MEKTSKFKIRKAGFDFVRAASVNLLIPKKIGPSADLIQAQLRKTCLNCPATGSCILIKPKLVGMCGSLGKNQMRIGGRKTHLGKKGIGCL